MRSVVLVCGDEPRILTESSDVEVVSGLCGDPRLVGENVGEADRAVLLLHRDRYDLARVQTALRRTGIDPLGAQIHDLVGGDEPVASRHVAALRRRAEQFAGSGPEHVKPVLPAGVSRRGFLQPPKAESVAAPAIDQTTCAADSGCRACVTVCPQSAYRWATGRISFDKGACIPCGRCITTCPTGAITNPAIMPAMVYAQVRELLVEADGSLGIRFVCSRGSIDPDEDWAEVVVPCASMVPASWLVACRLLGAGCATAVPCSTVGCPLGQDAVQVGQNELAATIMAEAGVLRAPVAMESSRGSGPVNPFHNATGSDIFGSLAAAAEQDFVIRSRAAESGIVEIDQSTCTLCGQCATICPTGALGQSQDGETVSITFDPSLCTNCAQCTSQCPELARSALNVRGCIDTRALRGGRVALNQGKLAACERCGAAIAPGSMMTRLSELLGGEFQATLDVLVNRCIECRGR